MKRSCRPWIWPAYRRLLQHSDWPILVGPWRGELGYEALYWLPWLDQLREDLHLTPARLIPISRGGMAGVYGTPTGLELHAMRSVQEIRIENRLQRTRTGMYKQMYARAFDKAIHRDVAKTLGLSQYLTLHPAWMFQDVQPFLMGERGLTWLMRRLRYAHWPAPPLPEGIWLPARFVAMRFYARATFPVADVTGQFAAAVLRQIATDTPVVLITSDLHVDDHVDFEPKHLPANVYRLTDLAPGITAENNLAIQSAVVARSLGFVGTYGGFAQLAQRFARPCITFYTAWYGTCLANKHLSQFLAQELGVPFHVLGLGELALLQSLLPRILVHGGDTENPLTTAPEEAHAVAVA